MQYSKVNGNILDSGTAGSMNHTKKEIYYSTGMVRLKTNSSSSEGRGFEEDVLQVRVLAPALEGKDNRALVETLSNWLHVPRCEVNILRGHTSWNTVVEIRGYTLQRLKELVG